MSEMVERLAEAMADADDYTSDYRLFARACLAAMREPTEGMKKAAWDVWTKHDKRRMSLAGGSGSLSHPDWETHYWQAMVDDALGEPR